MAELYCNNNGRWIISEPPVGIDDLKITWKYSLEPPFGFNRAIGTDDLQFYGRGRKFLIDCYDEFGTIGEVTYTDNDLGVKFWVEMDKARWDEDYFTASYRFSKLADETDCIDKRGSHTPDEGDISLLSVAGLVERTVHTRSAMPRRLVHMQNAFGESKTIIEVDNINSVKEPERKPFGYMVGRRMFSDDEGTALIPYVIGNLTLYMKVNKAVFTSLVSYDLTPQAASLLPIESPASIEVSGSIDVSNGIGGFFRDIIVAIMCREAGIDGDNFYDDYYTVTSLYISDAYNARPPAVREFTLRTPRNFKMKNWLDSTSTTYWKRYDYFLGFFVKEHNPPSPSPADGYYQGEWTRGFDIQGYGGGNGTLTITDFKFTSKLGSPDMRGRRMLPLNRYFEEVKMKDGTPMFVNESASLLRNAFLTSGAFSLYGGSLKIAIKKLMADISTLYAVRFDEVDGRYHIRPYNSFAVYSDISHLHGENHSASETYTGVRIETQDDGGERDIYSGTAFIDWYTEETILKWEISTTYNGEKVLEGLRSASDDLLLIDADNPDSGTALNNYGSSIAHELNTRLMFAAVIRRLQPFVQTLLYRRGDIQMDAQPVFAILYGTNGFGNGSTVPETQRLFKNRKVSVQVPVTRQVLEMLQSGPPVIMIGGRRIVPTDITVGIEPKQAEITGFELDM